MGILCLLSGFFTNNCSKKGHAQRPGEVMTAGLGNIFGK